MFQVQIFPFHVLLVEKQKNSINSHSSSVRETDESTVSNKEIVSDAAVSIELSAKAVQGKAMTHKISAHNIFFINCI